MKLYIEKIIIEKNGRNRQTFNFNKKLSVLHTDSELLDSIKAILGQKDVSRSSYSIDFLAQVSIDKRYNIRGTKKIGRDYFDISVYYDGSMVDCTEEYFNLIGQNEEMNSLMFFSNYDGDIYTYKFNQYKYAREYYTDDNFARITNNYGLTRSFRGFISQYIRNFKPIMFNGNHYLKLNEQGVFYADGNMPLSDLEENEFNYLCFLSIADFWDRAEKIRNLNFIKKPMIVSSFIETDDFLYTLKRTNKLNRQTILFLNKETLLTKYDVS